MVRIGCSIILAATLLSLTSCGEREYSLKFAGLSCKIPSGYFPPRIARPRTDEPYSLILRYYLPDFTPGRTRKLDPKYRGGHGDKITASIHRGTHGLISLYANWAASRPDGAPYTDAFGLRQVEVTDRTRKPGERNHLLLYRAEGRTIKTLIRCDPNPRSPPCEHFFNGRGINFKLTYSLRHLHQWKEIEKESHIVFERLCK